MPQISDKPIRSDIIKNLEDSIRGFETNFPLEGFRKNNFRQFPGITLLTCSDARMPVNIYGEIFNRIFSIENIGNQVKTNEGSILYGLLHLHTPIMIIAGHTDCGAIKAAKSNFIDEPLAIRHEVSIVKNSLEDAQRKTGIQLDGDSQLRITQLAELNVDMQIQYLLSNYAVADLVNNHKLLIFGLMVDLHNVHEEGHGITYTININGDNSLDKIKNYPDLGIFSERAKRVTPV